MVSLFFATGLVIAAVIIILAVHFFLPVRISGRLRSCRSDLFLLRIRWGILRVSVNISAGAIVTLYLYSFRIKEFPVTGTESSSGYEDEEKEKEEEKEGFNTKMISPVTDLLATVFRQTGFEYLRLDAKVGLGDPFDTGMIFGFAFALRGIMHCDDRFELNILPVFETEALEFDIEGGIRVKDPFRIFFSAFRIFRISRKKPEKTKGRGAAAI
ncbi:MAG: DUF2953 domain-containing protein [Methanomicrobiaceae archaeon]|nr:DUF2953 domain-containing protein [Methanomicrobiaceae archaeon]